MTTDQPNTEPVAYSDGKGTLNLHCLTCPRRPEATTALSVNDIDHWDQCRACRRYVVDVAREAAADRTSDRTETGPTIGPPQASSTAAGDSAADTAPALSPVHEMRAAGWRIQGWADADPDDQFGTLLSAWLYRVAQDWGPPDASGPYDAQEALALARLINASESR